MRRLQQQATSRGVESGVNDVLIQDHGPELARVQ